MQDLISRQAAIDAIGSYILSFTAIDRNYYEGLRDAKRLLNDIPSAEVEPVKHGRWKPFDLTWGRSIYACTSCGEAFEAPTEMEKPIFIYCPNCGAKMEPISASTENGQEQRRSPDASL